MSNWSFSSFKTDLTTYSFSNTKRIKLNKAVKYNKCKFLENLADDVEDSTDRETVLGIFKRLGVSEYHPQTVIQLIQFAQFYVTDVLMEAHNFSKSVYKTCSDIEDLQVVFDLRKENLSNLSPIISEDQIKAINSIPLPDVEFKFGICLPDLNSSLTNKNIRHISNKNINNSDNFGNQNKKSKTKGSKKNLIKQPRKKAVLQNPVIIEQENNKTEVPERKIHKSYMRCHGSPPKPPKKKRKIKY